MRTRYLAILACCGVISSFAQTPINKIIPIKAGQKISMHFDYPELVKVTTWDKNEISVGGTVSINMGENDDAFVVENSESGNTVKINSHIKDMKNLPQVYVIQSEGKKHYFRDKTELKKFTAEHGKYDYMSNGPEIDIILEIKVPKGVETLVESVYGMVEVKNFNGPITVDATYGGVDAAVQEVAMGELIAETNYGQIYSNLNVKFDTSREEDFHTYVSAKPGKGPRYSFESKYGNVYLRKPN